MTTVDPTPLDPTPLDRVPLEQDVPPRRRGRAHHSSTTGPSRAVPPREDAAAVDARLRAPSIPATLVDLFEATLRTHADRAALVVDGEVTTYRQLDACDCSF